MHAAPAHAIALAAGPVGRGEPRQQRVPVEERRLLLADRRRGGRKRDRDGARRPCQDRQDSCATSHRGPDCAIAPPVVRRITSATCSGSSQVGHVAAVAQDLGVHPGGHRAGRADEPVAVGPRERDRHVDLVEALEQRAAHLGVGAVEAGRQGVGADQAVCVLRRHALGMGDRAR